MAFKNLLTVLLVFGVILTIPINESIKIHDGGFSGPDIYLLYCGMLNPDVFGIKSNHTRSSVNLYYPAPHHKTFIMNFSGIKLKIHKVEWDKLIIEKIN